MPGRPHHSAKMKSCVDKLLEKGQEESSAYAICTKSLQDAGEPIFEGAESRSAEEKRLLDSKQRALHLRGATGTPRTEMIDGREHLIVPVVALMEGVIHAINAETPEFVSADLLMRSHRAWEGYPCVLGHPNKNGRQCSAYEDGMLDSHGFGTIRAPHMNGKRFGVEAVVDPERLKTLGQLQLLADLKDGKPIEVSVGAFVVTRPKSGEYNGKKYKAEWAEILPDHLAFLPNGRGACSREMGCGANRTASMHLVTAEAFDLLPYVDPIVKGYRDAYEAFFKSLMAAEDMCDYDVRDALNTALRTSVPLFRGVVDFFPESHRVVYMVEEANGNGNSNGDMLPKAWPCYRRTYKVADDGTVTFGKDVEEVKPTMSYEAASASIRTAMIRHEGGKWVLYSKDGSRRLGSHDTKADAEAQERAIESAKQRRSAELASKSGNSAATTAACGCGKQ